MARKRPTYHPPLNKQLVTSCQDENLILFPCFVTPFPCSAPPNTWIFLELEEGTQELPLDANTNR